MEAVSCWLLDIGMYWDVVITRAIAERCSPVIRNPIFNIEGDQARVNTGALRGLARSHLRSTD
jgi:hypothetical protein